MVLDDWRRDGASPIPSGHKPFSGWGHQKRKGVKNFARMRNETIKMEGQKFYELTKKLLLHFLKMGGKI